MLAIYCLSRFGAKCPRRQRYDPHIPPSPSTVGVVSVGVSLCRRRTGFRVVRASYYHMVAGVIVAWIGDGDDFCGIEVEGLREQISWYPSVVFRCFYIFSTRGSVIATTKSGDPPFGCKDGPIVCVAVLELLRLWVRVWECTQHQVIPRHTRRTVDQLRLLCLSVCCDWINLVGRTSRALSPTSTILNIRTDNR